MPFLWNNTFFSSWILHCLGDKVTHSWFYLVYLMRNVLIRSSLRCLPRQCWKQSFACLAVEDTPPHSYDACLVFSGFLLSQSATDSPNWKLISNFFSHVPCRLSNVLLKQNSVLFVFWTTITNYMLNEIELYSKKPIVCSFLKFFLKKMYDNNPIGSVNSLFFSEWIYFQDFSPPKNS